MKTIILLSIPFVIFASSDIPYEGEKLSNTEHRSIHSSNQRPTVKMNKKRKAHQLHKVDEEQAKITAKEETKEEVQSIRLTHHGKYLIYIVKTKQYTLIINALDGTVIKKQKN